MTKAERVKELTEEFSNALNAEFSQKAVGLPFNKEEMTNWMTTFLMKKLKSIGKAKEQYIQFDASMSGSSINMAASNMYTLLLSFGIYDVPYERVRGLEEFTIDGVGTFICKVVLKNGEVIHENYFKPEEPVTRISIKLIDVNGILKVDEDV